MPAATIFFTDIVGFSKRSTAEQRLVIDGLNREIVAVIKPQPEVIALPTGDGVALAFIHDGDSPFDVDVIFRVIANVQSWAGREKNVQLRIGVHVGVVSFITDVNGRKNICGDTINYSQRVMDAANGGQVLFSEATFREYVNDTDRRFRGNPFPDNTVAAFDGPIEVFAKHGLRIPVYKLTLCEDSAGAAVVPGWNNDDPHAKDWTLVTLTPLPKDITGDFSDHLADASRVAFI